MKAIFLFAGVVFSTCGVALAQASFAFQNNGTGQLITINDGSGAVPIGGNNAKAASLGAGPGQVNFQLWAGTNGAPVTIDPFTLLPTSGLALVGTTTNLGSTVLAAAGLFNGGNPYPMPAPFNGSFQIQFYYRAYTQNGFYLGNSTLATGYNLATGATPPTASFGVGANQVLGFSLVLIPEPSALSLTGLGLAAMLAFNRKSHARKNPRHVI